MTSRIDQQPIGAQCIEMRATQLCMKCGHGVNILIYYNHWLLLLLLLKTWFYYQWLRCKSQYSVRSTLHIFIFCRNSRSSKMELTKFLYDRGVKVILAQGPHARDGFEYSNICNILYIWEIKTLFEFRWVIKIINSMYIFLSFFWLATNEINP